MTSPDSVFADVAAGNRDHVAHHPTEVLPARAARGLALITCMDSRIDPLGALGMRPGDVKILRNAGARVTDDVLRTLVLASYLLGVTRVLVMPHTGCKMASATEAEVHETIWKTAGVDTRSIEFRTIDDPIGSLKADVQRIRSYPLLPEGLVVAGALYHVDTGELEIFDF